MKRRLALTFAGTAAIVVTAGSAAVAANLGILGSASEEPVGKLDASTVAELSTPVSSVDPLVVTVDEIVPVPVETAPPATVPGNVDDDDHDDDGGVTRPSGGSAPAPTVAPTPTTVRTDSSGPGSIDDDHESDDRSGHGGGDDEVEYEDD